MITPEEKYEAWIQAVLLRLNSYEPELLQYIESCTPELLVCEMVGSLGAFMVANDYAARNVQAVTLGALGYAIWRRFVMDEVIPLMEADEQSDLPTTEELDSVLKDMGLLNEN